MCARPEPLQHLCIRMRSSLSQAPLTGWLCSSANARPEMAPSAPSHPDVPTLPALPHLLSFKDQGASRRCRRRRLTSSLGSSVPSPELTRLQSGALRRHKASVSCSRNPGDTRAPGFLPRSFPNPLLEDGIQITSDFLCGAAVMERGQPLSPLSPHPSRSSSLFLPRSNMGFFFF